MQAKRIEYACLCSRSEMTYSYMFSNACMLGVKACMHVADVFQEIHYLTS